MTLILQYIIVLVVVSAASLILFSIIRFVEIGLINLLARLFTRLARLFTRGTPSDSEAYVTRPNGARRRRLTAPYVAAVLVAVGVITGVTLTVLHLVGPH